MKKLLCAAIVAALVALVGTAIAEEETASPYLELEFQMVGQDFVGLVPEGIRFDAHVRGVITDGLLAGATTTSIDYLLFRHDGVGVLDVRIMAVHPDGVTAAMTLKGFLGEPMPGLLEAMLDPEFEFRDADMPLHGALWVQTMAPQYAFVNHIVFGCVGTVNPSQGTVRYTCRSLAP